MSIQTLYIIHQSTHFMTFPIAIVMSWLYGKRYNFSAFKSISYGFFMMFLVVGFTYACKWIPGWLGYTVHINAARTFMFVLLFTLLMSKFWGISALHGADFLTPILFIARSVVLVGCTLLGCGQAVPCDWGIYSPSLGCTVFPMDLIDLLGTLGAGVISLLFAKRLNYNGNGKVFALAMYILGVIRLFLQLGSSDYWWIRGFNDESVYSIISIAMAVIIFAVNAKKQKINNSIT